MNRIIVDEYETELKNVTGTLVIISNNIHIHLMGYNKIEDIKIKENTKLTLDLESESTLDLTSFWNEKYENLEIKFNSKENTKLNCHLNIEASKSFKLKLQNNILGNNNESKIEIHVVANSHEEVEIQSTGYIKKQITNNVFLEELKGLTFKNAKITFLPNLIVDSDSVTANHNATIKCVDEEELFYLKSKGIDVTSSTILLKNGFLNKKEK